MAQNMSDITYNQNGKKARRPSEQAAKRPSGEAATTQRIEIYLYNKYNVEYIYHNLYKYKFTS